MAKIWKIVSWIKMMKRQKIPILASRIGMGPNAFREFVLPDLLSISCIKYDKKNDELLWVCTKVQELEYIRDGVKKDLERVFTATPY